MREKSAGQRVTSGSIKCGTLLRRLPVDMSVIQATYCFINVHPSQCSSVVASVTLVVVFIS